MWQASFDHFSDGGNGVIELFGQAPPGDLPLAVLEGRRLALCVVGRELDSKYDLKDKMAQAKAAAISAATQAKAGLAVADEKYKLSDKASAAAKQAK